MKIEPGKPGLPLWVHQTPSGIWWDVKRTGVRSRVDVSSDRVRVRHDRWFGRDEDRTWPLAGVTRVAYDRDDLEQPSILCHVPPMLGIDRFVLPVRPDRPYRITPIVTLLRELIAAQEQDSGLGEQDEAARAALLELTRQRTRSG